MTISNNIKSEIIEFIKNQELDINPVDNGFSRFHLNLENGSVLTPIISDGIFYFLKWVPNMGLENPWTYYNFKTLESMLDWLLEFDNSIPKEWWWLVDDGITDFFNPNNYSDNWWEFVKNIIPQISPKNNEKYQYLEFIDKDFCPKINHPHDKLSREFGIVNEVNKLNFEIHPIISGDVPIYEFRLLSNNDEKFQQWILFHIRKKKGLNLFLREFQSTIGYKF
jgi:hypothetical protein